MQTSTRRVPLEAASAFALGATPVAALGFADGGFFPRPWGWAAAGLSCIVVAAALLQRRVLVSGRALALLGLLAALGVWMAASLAWTQSVGLTVAELQRLLVYVTGVGAAALLVRAQAGRVLLLGVFAGTSTVVIWGLLSYLVTRESTTDVFQGSFLHRPMGYANAMAIVAVIALLLGLGIAADASSSRLSRIGAGIALVPLSSAFALTGSRAAWGALAVGLSIAFAIAPSRARTLSAWAWILLAPAVAVALVSATDATSSQIVGASADRLGERLLAALVALTALAAVPALIAVRTRPAPRRRRVRRRLWATPVVALVFVGAVVGLVLRASDLAGDRPTFWRVATDEFAERPALGSGAGTYAQVWLERRPDDTSVRDAHSIVVEALSELGIVGFVLVCMVLGAPLVWGARSRSRPLVPAATGAFGAFAAHASVDWDWEMPAVTLAGLFCAVMVAVTADSANPHALGAAPRGVAAALGAAGAALALAGLVGASALEDASRALARGDAAGAQRAAQRAERWQPWSAEPLLTRGRAYLSLGDRAAARTLFIRAAQRDPNDYRTWLALAAVNEGDAAQSAVQRARELNPKAVRGA